MACPADFTGIATDSRGNVLINKTLKFANFNTTTLVATAITDDKGRFTVTIADATSNKIDIYEGLIIPANKQLNQLFLGTITLSAGLLDFCATHFGDTGDCHSIGDLLNPNIFGIINHYSVNEVDCTEFWNLFARTPVNDPGQFTTNNVWQYEITPNKAPHNNEGFIFSYALKNTPLISQEGSDPFVNVGTIPIFYNEKFDSPSFSGMYIGAFSGIGVPGIAFNPPSPFNGQLHFHEGCNFNGFRLGIISTPKSESVKILAADISIDQNLIQFDFEPENEIAITGGKLLHFTHEGTNPSQSDSFVFRKVGTKYEFIIQTSSGPLTFAILEYAEAEVEQHFIGKPNVTIQLAWDRSTPIDGTDHMFVKINGTLLTIVGVSVGQSPWAANNWSGGIYLGTRDQVVANDQSYPGVYSNLKIFNDTTATTLKAHYKLDDNAGTNVVIATFGNPTTLQEDGASKNTNTVNADSFGIGFSCDCLATYDYFNSLIWQRFMSYTCATTDPITNLFTSRIYYNSATNIFRFFDGTKWMDFGNVPLNCFTVDHNSCDGSAVEGWHKNLVHMGILTTDYLAFQRFTNRLEIHPGRDDTASNKEDQAIFNIVNFTSMPFRTTFLFDSNDPQLITEDLRPIKIYASYDRTIFRGNTLFFDAEESVYTGNAGNTPSFNFGLVFREQDILIDKVKSNATLLSTYPVDEDRAFNNKGRTSFSRDVQKPAYWDGIKWRRFNKLERGNGEQNRTPIGYYYERDEAARFILKWTLKGQLFSTDYGRTYQEVTDIGHVWVWKIDGDYDSGVLEDISDHPTDNTNHTTGVYTITFDKLGSTTNLVESTVDGSKFVVFGEYENYKNIIEPGVKLKIQSTSTNSLILIGRPPFVHELNATNSSGVFTRNSGDSLNPRLRTLGLKVVLKKSGTKHRATVTAITSTDFTVDQGSWGSSGDPGNGDYDVELFYSDALEQHEQASTGSILEAIGNKGNFVIFEKRSSDTQKWNGIKFFHKMIFDYCLFNDSSDIHDNDYNSSFSEIWIINCIFETNMNARVVFLSTPQYHFRFINNHLKQTNSHIKVQDILGTKAERIWVMNNIFENNGKIELEDNADVKFKMIRNNWFKNDGTVLDDIDGNGGTFKLTDTGENGYSSTSFGNIDSTIGRQLYEGNFIGTTFPSGSSLSDSLNPFESVGYNLVDDYFCGLGPGEYDRIGFIHSFVTKNLKDVTASLIFLLRNARDASSLPLVNFAQSGGSDISTAGMTVLQSDFNGTFNTFSYSYSTTTRCWFVDLLYTTAPTVNTFFHIKYQDSVPLESI